MNKLNEKLIKAQCAGTNFMYKNGITPETIKKRAGTVRIIVSIMSVACLMLAMMVPAFAADTIESKVSGGLHNAYNVIQAVAGSIGAVGIAAGAILFFFGGKDSGEKAKKLILYSAIGLAVVFLAPIIVNQISGWFAGSDVDGVWSGTVPE